eukprot:613474-Hanusia_phi.AAC.1
MFFSGIFPDVLPLSATKVHPSSCRAILTSTNNRGSFLPSESSWAMPNPFARMTGSLSANSSPVGRRSTKLRRDLISSNSDEESILDDFKLHLSPSFWGLRQISEPLTRKVEDYEIVDVQYVYNAIVDGMAGHILVDTRSAEAFKEEHIFGSILLDDCVHRWGRHAVLISETGDVSRFRGFVTFVLTPCAVHEPGEACFRSAAEV